MKQSTEAPAVWSFADLVDFESLLHEDTQLMESGHADLVESGDREIFKKTSGAELTKPGSEHDRRKVFRAWLEERRKLHADRSPAKERFTPGSWILGMLPSARLVLFVMGALLGSVAVALHSSYGGLRVMPGSGVAEPANVLSYMGVCLALPILFMIGVLILMKNPWRIADLLGLRLLFALSSGLVLIILRRLAGVAAGTLGRKSVERLDQVVALLKARLVSGNSILKWPFIVTMQFAGLGFAMAVPAKTMLQNLASDRGYGWQTSMSATVSPERVYQSVQLISVPWRWLPVSWARMPDLAAVRNSQVSYSEAGRNFRGDALRAWGPFLVLATLVWGLLPRVLLLSVALIAQNRALRLLTFQEARCDRLMRRLTTPLRNTTPPMLTSNLMTEEAPTPSGLSTTAGNCVMLIPSEFRSVADLPLTLARVAEDRLGWHSVEHFEFGASAESNREVVLALESKGSPELRRVLVFQDASAPPITGTITFLKRCKTSLGRDAEMVVVLMGTPEESGALQRADPQESSAWERKITRLGDPRLGVMRL